MRLTGDPAPGTMNSSGSGNFLLVPIPEYPLLDCVPNKTVKIVVLGASNVGKTGMRGMMEGLIMKLGFKNDCGKFPTGAEADLIRSGELNWENCSWDFLHFSMITKLACIPQVMVTMSWLMEVEIRANAC